MSAGRSPLLRRTSGASAPVQISPIKAVEIAASRLGDVVSLAQGIPSFDTPEPIKRFVVERLAEGACARYSLSPGLPELRELLAEALLADGMRYDPDGEILVTCGAIEAIASTLLALVEPGDEVIVASPTYASYLPAIRLAGARPRFVALDEDRNFDLDTAAIARAIGGRTRAVLLCNPNNPTGTIYSPEQTAELMRLADRHGLLVVTDEVYKDFLYGNEEAGNPARLEAYRDRVLRIGSFSKAYGMTGWRVGFLHGDRRLVDEILAVHDTIVTCAPVVSQYAAIAALRFGAPFIAEFRREFRERRDRVVERLDALDQVFDYQMPSASYFAFPRVKDTVPLARNSRALAHDILERARVALVPGVAFGPTGEAHLRICYARPPQDIERAFDRLEDYFAGRSPRAYALPAPAERSRRAPRWQRAAQATLRRLARLRLARQRPQIVAIAGGRGKTVLKRMLAELLREHFRVRANPLSHNTETGLALAVLDVRAPDVRPRTLASGFADAVANALTPDAVDVLVLEFGARQPGDMQALLSIVIPDVVVLTPLAVGEADDIDAMQALRAELRVLLERVPSAAVLVCRDDPALRRDAPAAPTFGAADLVVEDGHRILVCGDERYGLGRDLVGATAVRAAAASVLVARRLGVAAAAVQAYLTPS